MRGAAAALAEREIWVVGPLVAATVASERVLPLAVGAAALFWGLRWLGTGAPAPRTAADWPIGLLALLALLSLAITVLPATTGPQVLRLLAGIALYYAIVTWASREERLWLLQIGLGGTGLLLALAALFSVQWMIGAGKLPFVPATLYERLQPVVADSVNPNVMAGYLALLLPLIAAPLLFAWRPMAPLLRAAVAGVALLISAVLVLTQSRGGLLALASGGVVLLSLRWPRLWPLFILAPLAGGLSVAVSGSGTVLAYALTSGVSLGGLPERIEVWSRGIYMVQDFFFTGVGMGSFEHVAATFYPFVIAPLPIPHVHNLFLQVAVDLGVPGLVAWLAVLLLVFAAAWQVYRRGMSLADGRLAGLGAGLLAGQVALVLHGTIDAVTWGMVKAAVIIWALWGTTMAAQRLMVDHLLGVLLKHCD